MAKRKAPDGAGLVVEMLQQGGQELWMAIAETFSVLLRSEMLVPKDWRNEDDFIVQERRSSDSRELQTEREVTDSAQIV